MNTSTLLTAILVVALGASGCASKPKRQVHSDTPVSASIGVQPARQEYPQQPIPSTQMPVRSGYETKAVYRDPVIRTVHLEPYVDANGNAFGPSVMYQVEDPGGWNVEALKNPSSAYVPANMRPGMTTPAAPNTIVVANSGQDPVATPTKSIRELYKIEDVEVLGFIERSQEPLAAEMEAKKNGTHVRFFDDNLGWILIPKASLAKQHG